MCFKFCNKNNKKNKNIKKTKPKDAQEFQDQIESIDNIGLTCTLKKYLEEKEISNDVWDKIKKELKQFYIYNSYGRSSSLFLISLISFLISSFALFLNIVDVIKCKDILSNPVYWIFVLCVALVIVSYYYEAKRSFYFWRTKKVIQMLGADKVSGKGNRIFKILCKLQGKYQKRGNLSKKKEELLNILFEYGKQ